MFEEEQFAQAYERLRAKIIQERRKAKQIGHNIWIIIVIVFLFILLSGGEWYWFVICIIGLSIWILLFKQCSGKDRKRDWINSLWTRSCFKR